MLLNVIKVVKLDKAEAREAQATEQTAQVDGNRLRHRRARKGIALLGGLANAFAQRPLQRIAKPICCHVIPLAP